MRSQLRTIAIANQKGGCGKTTVAVNLASSLVFLGKKVLLIDLDPQGHSSLALGVKLGPEDRSTYDLLDDAPDHAANVADVRKRISTGLDIVPAEVVLSAVEQKLAGAAGRENRLMNKLQGLDDTYDFVLVDCPPNLGLLTFNALRAAGELIVPVECSSFSLHGLSKIRDTVLLLDELLNHRIRVRALLNDYDPRTKFSRQIKEQLASAFAGQVFKTCIHHSVKLREAAAAGKAIIEFDRRASAFQDFMNLAAEILEKETVAPPPIEEFFSVPAAQNPVPEPAGVSIEPAEDRAVLFTFKAPGARFVQIAGDFNQWVPDELWPPIKEGGIWRKLYHLKKGVYKYKFIVDGEWKEDPQNCRSEPNPFGGWDSVIDTSQEEVADGAFTARP